MLISTRGDEAESHAKAQRERATEQGDEGDEIVWQGIITQLAKIRAQRQG